MWAKGTIRAAFGIYNFEFRNKKIGFNIPDELLLQYLAQRHDLTNFVIEIGQGNDEANMLKEQLNYEPSCSQKQMCVALPQKSNESSTNLDSPLAQPTQLPSQLYGMNASNNMAMLSRSRSPLDAIESQTDHGNVLETDHKIRVSHVYNQNNPDAITQAIGPMVVPKAEQDDSDMIESRDLRYERQESQQQQHQIHHHHQQHESQQQHHHQQQMHQQQQLAQHFVGNFVGHHSMLVNANNNSSAINNPSSPLGQVAPPTQSAVIQGGGLSNIQHNTSTSQQQNQPQYSPVMMSRFRRRGERMSKDQKELYVKFFEENPCMLTQRRNDVLLEPLWNKLANLLNSVPQGAVKNVEEWKQTFDAWRYRVFMYTRYNTKLEGAAAQNPKNYKPLTPTDQRAYAMWTSHKSTAPQDFEKMEMFSSLDESQTTDYDY
ncbi:uncharacterized protein LOC142233424 isoform X3 [Haematobia irritans]|uniref:uncharacterized protein LOC142233424 isoform X3 n=1 Tax=Haematobia irritans TaxID=7368 RepID=UPI003F4FA0DA